MSKIKAYVFGCLTILVIILIWQNTEVVTIKILFWQVSMSRAILIPSIFLCGVVFGYLASKKPVLK
ncbi:MAG: LapA family protein [Candidatus Omnitrophica bacterium]|nr:LapA family protein [Candidatus Omnitrophota bacterium]